MQVDKTQTGGMPDDEAYVLTSEIGAYPSDKGDVVFSHLSSLAYGEGSYGYPYTHFAKSYVKDMRDDETLNLAKRADGSRAIVRTPHLLSSPIAYGLSADGKTAIGITDDVSELVANDTNGYRDIVIMKTGL